MDLTQEKILEMTETIARACGFHCERIKSHVYRVEMLSGEEESFSIFDPFESWDDAFMAADVLTGLRVHITPEVRGDTVFEFFVGLGFGDGIGDGEYAYWAIHRDRLTAFCIALHEAAKVKLEGYQNEDGN